MPSRLPRNTIFVMQITTSIQKMGPADSMCCCACCGSLSSGMGVLVA